MEYLSPFKLFMLWMFALYLFGRLAVKTPLPPDESRPQVDLNELRRQMARESWRERPYNERLCWHWINWTR